MNDPFSGFSGPGETRFDASVLPPPDQCGACGSRLLTTSGSWAAYVCLHCAGELWFSDGAWATEMGNGEPRPAPPSENGELDLFEGCPGCGGAVFDEAESGVARTITCRGCKTQYRSAHDPFDIEAPRTHFSRIER